MPGLLLLALHAWSYMPFMSDDAFISLRYARRLLDGFGLTWTDGPPVEGYSNLLWVLATAALGALGVDLVVAARLLGLLGMGLTVVLLTRVAGRGAGPAAGAVFGLVIAGSAPIAVWAVGGLEQPLLAALLAVAAVGVCRLAEGSATPVHLWLSSAAMALMCWTRPDAPLLCALLGLGLLIARPNLAGLRQVLLLGLAPAFAVLLQLGFRIVYYVDWVPNTAHVKGGLSGARALEGLSYVARGLGWQAGLLLLAAGIVLSPIAWRRAAVYLPALLGWCAYVALVGGDIFPAWRHLVPAVVLLGLIAAEGLGAVRARWGSRRLFEGLAAALALTVLGSVLDGAASRARDEIWEWRSAEAGQFLSTLAGEARPLVAVQAAGALPYFSGLPSLDLLGLNDRHIATHPPATAGEGLIGHDLGDADYSLAARPDIFVFCAGAGKARPCFSSGREIQRAAIFRRDYQRVNLLLPSGEQGVIYLRRVGVLGVARRVGRVVVPAILLSDPESGFIRLNNKGKAVAVLGPDAPGQVDELRLGPGRWRAQLASGGADARLSLQNRDGAPLDPDGFELDDSGLISGRIDCGGECTVSSLGFRRLDAGADALALTD